MTILGSGRVEAAPTIVEAIAIAAKTPAPLVHLGTSSKSLATTLASSLKSLLLRSLLGKLAIAKL